MFLLATPLYLFIALEPYIYQVNNMAYPAKDADIPTLALAFPLIIILPAIFLHIRYYTKNKGTLLTINPEKKTIDINSKGQLYSYNYSDIDQIIRTNGIGAYNVEESGYLDKKIPNYGRRVPMYGSFGYIKLIFSDGNEFYFTSLALNIRTFFYDNNLEGVDTYSSFPYL